MKKRFAQGLLVTSALASPLALPLGAAAQTGPETPSAAKGQDTAEMNVVTVTGIRGSLESARNFKRDASQFVDAIVADDIGKLPDTNVAESLARVSGVQVDRGIGEGTSVSVRGLRQNVFLLNGREIVDSTGRGGTGLDQLLTSTYGLLAMVPSELISRLEVTKLAGANEIAGGLGGIVDIRTRMPLDGPVSQVVVKASGDFEELPGKTGNEFFGLYSSKFANNTAGFLASISTGTRNLEQQGLDTFSGYKSYVDGGVTRYGNQDVRATDIQEKRKKFGVDAVFQWRPNPGFELIADTFYSKLDSNRDRNWISFTPTAGLTGATYSTNNILLKGNATSPVLSNTEFADVASDMNSSALRAKFTISENLKGSAEASYGTANQSYHQLYMRLQNVTSLNPNVDFDLTNGDFGSFKINGLNLSDPSQLRMTILFDNLYRASTSTKAVRTDYKWTLDSALVESAEFGARYNQLASIQNPLRADIRPSGGIPATQLSSFLQTYSNNDFMPSNFVGLPRTYIAAARSAFTSCSAFTAFPVISQDPQCLNGASVAAAVASTFEVDETFTEAYAKLNFDTNIAKTNLSGNVGVRMVQRHMDSIGNLIGATGATTPTTFKSDDSAVLPSATFRWSLDPNTIIRVGAAKVIAFPNTADLNNGVTLNNNAVFNNGVQIQNGSGTGGAPGLQPFKANQLDLSVETYFGKQAMASVGLFSKDVSSFIIQQQSAETYSGVNYLINRKVNGQGASVLGAEALVQMPFYFLPAPFNSFGVMATYSYIDSSTPIVDAAGRALPLPGLSKNNTNLVGYYEAGPLSVRLAYNWRNPFLLSLSAANTGIYNDEYKDLSTTIRYDFDKNVSLGFEVNNLLNSQQRTYDGSPEGLRTNVLFGRIYKANVNLKF